MYREWTHGQGQRGVEPGRVPVFLRVDHDHITRSENKNEKQDRHRPERRAEQRAEARTRHRTGPGNQKAEPDTGLAPDRQHTHKRRNRTAQEPHKRDKSRTRTRSTTGPGTGNSKKSREPRERPAREYHPKTKAQQENM